jgi:hypothetical protein
MAVAEAESSQTRAVPTASLFKSLTAEHLAIAVLVAAAAFILVTKNSSFFNFWTDRDMVRSANLLNEFQYMAAELSYGAASRVPGGALHYLWFLPTLVSEDPNLSYKFCVLLCLLAAVPLYTAMRTYFGASAAIVTVATLFASPVTFSTMMRLWNPSFQIPFLFLAFACLVHLLAGRRTGAFKWLVASLVIAMQMHVSTWLLMIAFTLALIVTRTRVPLREAAWSVMLTLALLAPYLIGEILTGWDNIRTMLASQGRGAVRHFDLSKGILFNFDNSRDIWAWFAMSFGMTDNLPEPPFRAAFSWLHNLALVIAGFYTVLSLAWWLDWGKPIARALGLELGGGAGRLLVGALMPLLIAIAYTSYSPQMELVVYGNSRYVMFAVPALSITAGLGAWAVMSLARGSRIGEAVAALPVIAAAGLPLWSLATSVKALDRPETPAGRQFMGSFGIVSRDRGWSMEDTIARMVVLRHHDPGQDRWIFESIFAIGYELYRNRMSQPFSRGGQCVAYLTSGTRVHGEKGVSEAVLERTFAQPHATIRIVSQRPVGQDRLVVYERIGMPCFTSISNRYVFSPEENAMHQRYGLLRPGSAEPVAADLARRTFGIAPGVSSWIASIDPMIYTLVKLSRSVSGGLAIEFHSNQLRGDTYNGGFLDIGMIEGPRLVLEPVYGGAPTAVEIQKGLVGGKGTFTPISLKAPVPPGTYRVRLEGGVFPPVPLGKWPVDLTAKKPFSIPLTEAYEVAR